MSWTRPVSLLLLFALGAAPAAQATFSLCAIDPKTGDGLVDERFVQALREAYQQNARAHLQ